MENNKEVVEVLRGMLHEREPYIEFHTVHNNKHDLLVIKNEIQALGEALLWKEKLDKLEKWRSDEHEDCFNAINCEGFPKKVLKYGYGEKVKFLEKLNEVLQNGK